MSEWARADVVDLLRKARDLLAAGWTQQTDHRYFGRRDLWCLKGALLAAAGGPCGAINTAAAELRALLVLGHPEFEVYPGAWSVLVAWNDDPARKQQEVVALLDAAIAEP